MENLHAELGRVIAQNPWKITLSGPRHKQGLKRATLTATDAGWQVEKLDATKAYHSRLPGQALAEALAEMLLADFTQLTAQTPTAELRLRLSKKNKVLTSRSAGGAPPPDEHAGHNRQKNYLLPEGKPIAPLVDMGIFTPEGRVVQKHYDKFRQVNRFVELVDDSLREVPPEEGAGPFRVIDFGCGKSTLTFVLYHYLHEVRGLPVEMTGLDLKSEVVANCNAAARKYGYSALHFEVGDIARYNNTDPVDLMVSLHACDTATDEALARGVRWGAQRLFSVPCCQHELNAQWQQHDPALHLLARYGIIRERTSALMTDAIRANLLCACGYKAQVLEFVDLAHTPKNLLIRAQKTRIPLKARRQALDEMLALCKAFDLDPSLLRLLRQHDLLAGLEG